jgi:hypothetical protein
MKQIAVTKKQHEAVIQILLNNLHVIRKSNWESAARNYEQADACEKDTLGYYTAMVDGDRNKDFSRKVSDAICLITEITGTKRA